MKSIFLSLIKPKSTIATKWFFILAGALFIILADKGYFPQVMNVLSSDTYALTVGGVSFTLYRIIKSFILIVIVFYLASIVSDIGENKINNIQKMRASNKALLVKVYQIILYFLFFLFVLDSIGLDITTFAVFGGAIGIGVGFGLQKITSNFISGIILLFEKSIEAGDLVELSDGTFGFVGNTGARSTLITAFDGRDIMIPNEDFIVNRVINWTYNDHKARVEISIGVSYDSDLEKVQAIILEAAKQHPRCMQDPEPACFLREFADSSVNFLLFFWVNDVKEGRYGPTNDVLFTIWNRFKEEGIEIPFPQRDVHIKSIEGKFK